MIFENNQLMFRVIDVLRIEQHNIKKYNANRHFCALSFREATDARITWQGAPLEMRRGVVTFFPADVDYLREATVDEMTVIHFELFNYTAKEIESFVTAEPEALRALFHAAYDEWMKNRPDRQYRVTGMLYTLFAQLYNEYAQQTGGYSPLLRGAVRYIGLHFSEAGLTVGKIARQANICEVYLRRLFQREIHMTPKQYIHRLRMQYAVSLLGSGYYPIAQIAKMTGFADEKYFSTAFKRAMGCSPSQYVYSFDG